MKSIINNTRDLLNTIEKMETQLYDINTSISRLKTAKASITQPADNQLITWDQDLSMLCNSLWHLPAADGAAATALGTDGAGQLGWYGVDELVAVGLTNGYIPYYDVDHLADTNIFYDNGTNYYGFGTNLPTQQVELTESICIPDTTANNLGVIYKDTHRFIHNFHHPIGMGAVPVGHNIFIGIDAGNFTTGSTATGTSYSSYNVGTGDECMVVITTGYANSAIGYRCLYRLTTGYHNMAIGLQTGYNLIGGYDNVMIGSLAMYYSLTGYKNVALGFQAGMYISAGANQTCNESIYIGFDTRALADGDVNEIVIGNQAVGLGSNTVVLGNSSIATTRLYGDVGVNINAPLGRVDICEGNITLYLGADDTSAGNVRTDSADKSAAIGVIQWDNDEEGVYLAFCSNTSTANIVDIGGGDPQLNAATQIGFFTAENVTTNIGTERMRITTYGNIGIGTVTPRVVASYTYGTSERLLSIYNASNRSVLNLEGNPVQINMVDNGGGVNDKWATLYVDAGVLGFASINDNGVIRTADILVMDMGTGFTGFGISTMDSFVHIHKGTAGAVTAAADAVVTIENNSDIALSFLCPDGDRNDICFGDTSDNDIGRIRYNHGTNYMSFVTNAGERERIDSSGNVSISTATALGRFDVCYDGAAGFPTVALGADAGIGVTTRTNVTAKAARIGVAHYTNAEEPVCLAFISSQAAASVVDIGGGTGFLNAATEINFYTAANTITTIGTLAMTIGSNQRVGIGIAAADGPLHVHTSTAGAVAAGTPGNDLVVEKGDDVGMSFLSPVSKSGAIYFGSPNNNAESSVGYSHGAAINTGYFFIYVSGNEGIRVITSGGVMMPNLKSGATQAAAGAAANELWVTSGHATQEDNTVMIGV